MLPTRDISEAVLKSYHAISTIRIKCKNKMLCRHFCKLCVFIGHEYITSLCFQYYLANTITKVLTGSNSNSYVFPIQMLQLIIK